MSRKRRIFDISMPEDDVVPPADALPSTPPEAERGRRGPMATAINETAATARERQKVEALIRQENDALAHEHIRLKSLGLVLQAIPLDQIETFKLTRDRTAGPDPELEDLKASIVAIGLSNPIRVEPRADGRFELIQGYRRLSAYRALLTESGGDDYAEIPAAITPQGDSLEALYRRMVDENLVRKDISFAEMAQLALDYAADPETSEHDPDKTVALLFKSAGYQKRSYIRSFIKVVRQMEGVLLYAHEMPRALGLALATQLEEQPGLTKLIEQELKGWENRSAADELNVLRRFAKLGDAKEMGQGVGTPAAPKLPAEAKAKTSFQFDRREGRAKCVATAGRIEIRLPRDFSTIDRRRLEIAVQNLLDQLE